MTRAYCGGTFDLFHPGHKRFFEWAHNHFDEVVAVVNTDEFCARYKQDPVQCLPERLEMVESCRYVDRAVVNEGDEDSTKTILEVAPTHIVNGSDWTRNRLMKQMGLNEDFLTWNDIVIAICPLHRHFSTTELKNRVRTQK